MRILAFILLLISILYLPFWLSVILLVIFSIYFKYLYEASILFLLSDLLFGVKEIVFFNFPFVSLVASIIIITIIEIIKKKVRFYDIEK